MQYFDFSGLIEKYSVDLQAEIPAKGEYNARGEHIKGEPQIVTIRGAVISRRLSKIFRSDGMLTMQDKALFMLSELPNALQGALITDGNKTYHIADKLENGAFTGVYAYTLKFNSALSKEASEW